MTWSAAQHKNNKVTNVFIFDDEADPSIAEVFNAIPCPSDVQIGWNYIGDVFSAPEAAPPEEPNPPLLVTYKSDIARRATESEAQQLRALLEQQSAQFWLLYMGVQEIHHDSPEFPMLQHAFTQLLGADRAAELLAPSIVVAQ